MWNGIYLQPFHTVTTTLFKGIKNVGHESNLPKTGFKGFIKASNLALNALLSSLLELAPYKTLIYDLLLIISNYFREF